MEKRKFVFVTLISIIFVLCMLQIVSAQLTLEKEAIHEVVAKELSQPATFSAKVKNLGNQTDFFEFYTFVNVMLSPRGGITILAGEEKELILGVYPSAKLRDERKGSYTFVYYMKSADEIKEDRLIIKILPLDEILKVDFPKIITMDTSYITLGIENQENIVLNDTLVSVEAAFIDASERITLDAFGKENVTIAVDTNKIRNVLAGKYLVKVSFKVGDSDSVDVIKEVEIGAESNIVLKEEVSGNLFYPVVKITKTNMGNTVTDVDLVVRKNVFANAFTTFSLKADEIERSATSNAFIWYTTLKPGDSFSVEIKTNYILPLGILLAIAVIVVLITIWLRTNLVIKKKAIRIRSKTGEFAIKVMLLIKARHDLDNIFIRDRMPRLTELHERYGHIRPSKVDKARKMIEWHIPHLAKGEEQIISYVIYSKVSILGKFELPKATASFENAKGEQKNAASNAVLFFSEERVPM